MLRISGAAPGWSIGILMPKAMSARVKTQGLGEAKLTQAQIAALQRTLQSNFNLYDPAQFRACARSGAARISGFPTNRQEFDLMLLFTAAKEGATRGSVTFI